MRAMKIIPGLLLLLSLMAFESPAAASGKLKIFQNQFCLDVTGGVLQSGTALQIFSCWPDRDVEHSLSQVWKLQSTPNGSEIRLAANPGLCLDVTGSVDQDGTRVQVYTCNGTAAQLWDVLPGPTAAENVFKSKLPAGRCLDVRGGVQTAGTAVQIHDCNGTVSQNWFRPPVAAAWMFMADDQNYSQIPQYWSSVDFSKVDVLYIGPAGVQDDGRFGLYNSSQTGNLDNRFRWIINRARAQNPNIKILVSQWWGDGVGKWGRALSALSNSADISKYATSVRDFLASYLGVSGGVDGYDIDYEDNNVSANIGAIAQQVRQQLASLSTMTGGRYYYQTVSPATVSHLQGAVAYVDFVNMQTYEGGSSLTPQSFLSLGLRRDQLFYGICPETNCTPSPGLDQVKSAYASYRLAGIHLWRLNSDNYQHEGSVQSQVYDFLH